MEVVGDTDITGDVTWTADKVWLVTGIVLVKGGTLTIEPGAKVLLGVGSGIRQDGGVVVSEGVAFAPMSDEQVRAFAMAAGIEVDTREEHDAYAALGGEGVEVVGDTDITGDVTWTADKMWIVTGIVIVKGGTLTIEPGAKVLLGVGSGIRQDGGVVVSESVAFTPMSDEKVRALASGQTAIDTRTDITHYVAAGTEVELYGEPTWTAPNEAKLYTLSHADEFGNWTAEYKVVGDNVIVVGDTGILADTTWTSDKTWIIAGTVLVQGGTLTIEPGTTVLLGVGSGIRQDGGTVVADGVAFSNIAFDGRMDYAEAEKGNVRMDTDVGHLRVAAKEEPIAFSSLWGESAAEQVKVSYTTAYGEDAEIVSEAGPAEGEYVWQAETPGYYTFAHLAGGETLTAEFVVTDSEATEVVKDGEISESTDWSRDKVILIDGILTVKAGSTLTIAPGAVVKFMDGAGIVCEAGGRCVADGVIFTHVNDDTVGGDTLFDGSTSPLADMYVLSGVSGNDATQYRYHPDPTVTLSGTISKNEVWRGFNVYHVTGNITIQNGVTLTIEPGAIIKFDTGLSLTVNSGATLNAFGTRAQPIVFTSINDDNYGGDTNGDGKSEGNLGDWGKIGVNGGTANFEYTHILYSSRNATTGAINMNGGSVVFSNGEIAHGLYDAVGVESGSFFMTNSVIRDCLLAFRHWARDPIVNCVIYDCGRLTQGGGQHFVNCVFSHITETWEAFGFPQNGTTYRNCCFWNEGGSVLTGEGVQDAMTVCGRDGNVWGDPRFLDPGNGDFRVDAKSPCMDAGLVSAAPATDYFGQPRVNAPDMGICEVVPRGETSNFDLVPQSVAADAEAVSGQPLTINWTVTNQGGADIDAEWRDALSLVSENGRSVALGEKVVSRRIVAGGTISCSASFIVPAISEGIWYPKVNVNSSRDIFEGALGDNNALTGETATKVVSAALDVGSEAATELSLDAGKDTTFRLANDAETGSLLVIRTDGDLSAWLGLGGTVLQGNALRSAVKIAEGLWLLQVPAGKDAYVTLANGSADAQAISMVREHGNFFLFGMDRVTAVNGGNVSINFSGTGFEDGMLCQIYKDGDVIDAIDVNIVSPVSGIATFPVTGASPGDWNLAVTRRNEMATIPALTLTEGRIGPKFACRLNLSSQVRLNREYSGVFEYCNVGDMSLAAPYVKISANAGTQIRLTEADAWTDTIELMAISKSYPASLLKPGETNRVTFLYKSVVGQYRISYEHAPVESIDFLKILDEIPPVKTIGPVPVALVDLDVDNPTSSAKSATRGGGGIETLNEIPIAKILPVTPPYIEPITINEPFPRVDLKPVRPPLVTLPVFSPLVDLLPSDEVEIPGKGVYKTADVTEQIKKIMPVKPELQTMLKQMDEFPWETNAGYMRPTWATDAMWSQALAILKTNLGTTWHSYQQRMRNNADFMMKIGRPTYRLEKLFQMEINEALGIDRAVQTLARGTDLVRSGRGMGLSFGRTYPSAMCHRMTMGRLGYGWMDNYSIRAEMHKVIEWTYKETPSPSGWAADVAYATAAAPKAANASNYGEILQAFGSGKWEKTEKVIDGATVEFHLPSGSSYTFERQNGVWQPQSTFDKTTMKIEDGEYVLAFVNGTVFRLNYKTGRPTSIRDNQGNELTYTYSGNNLVKVEHSDGQSLTFTYSGDKIASVADDQGRTVSYGYTDNLLTSVTAFNGLVTRYVYHDADSTPISRALSQIAYPDGTTKDYTYDDQGRVATVSVNGSQFTTEIVRGVCGSYSVIAPNGGVTAVTVGASGEALKTVNALGQKVEQMFTEDTLLESVIAPSGKRNKISYDSEGKTVAALSASGAETKFSYEPDFDNLASVTDTKGHAISYGYDNKGRGNSISYVDGSASSLEYDERGDVVKSTNRRGESIAYEYDAEGNLIKRTWPNGRIFTMAYDAKGNVTNATDSVTGEVTMEYDEYERLSRIVYPKDRGFTYAYDAVGRIVERTALGGPGSLPSAADTQRFTYDSLGRLATVTDGEGTLYLTNAYDPTTGWLLTQTYGNGTVVSNAYDVLGRTVGIYHGRAVSMKPPHLAFFEYAYDIDGKCISQTTAEGTESYTYDADGQLTGVTYPDGTSESFAYDAVGNRITHSGTTGVSPVDETYTVNSLNQYTAISGGPTSVSAIEYDLDGNMTRNGDTYYTYDTLSRLVAVTNETKNIHWSCEYDVFGNRVSVTDDGTTTEKVYIQGSLPSVSAEYVNDSLTKRHVLVGAVRLADLTGTTGVSPVASSARYYHSDLLGSARLLTDGTGVTKGTRSFKAFGETRIFSGETTDAGYVGTLGVETDSNGLLFMRNRYYDAGMGRFVQMDPIGLTARDVNIYRYCHNSSMSKNDANGLAYVVCLRTRPLESWSSAYNGNKGVARHDQIFIYDKDTGRMIGNFGKGDAGGVPLIGQGSLIVNENESRYNSTPMWVIEIDELPPIQSPGFYWMFGSNCQAYAHQVFRSLIQSGGRLVYVDEGIR